MDRIYGPEPRARAQSYKENRNAECVVTTITKNILVQSLWSGGFTLQEIGEPMRDPKTGKAVSRLHDVLSRRNVEAN